MIVTLRPLLERDLAAVRKLAVSDDQRVFVDAPGVTLDRSGPPWEPFVIEAGGQIVGIFHIDSLSGEQTIAGALEVHEVLIDRAYQGKGLGKAFTEALPAFLKAAYPDRDTACLTVNCRNHSAYRVYLHGGFADTGDIYPHGRSGPQHIMRLDLGAR